MADLVILGASGFLGSRVAAEASMRKRSVRALSRAECDVTDRAQVFDVIMTERPKAVINCAAVVDFTNARAAEMTHVNQHAVLHTIEACVEAKARLVQSSTIAVYGQTEQIDANSPLDDVGTYATTKSVADFKIEKTPRLDYGIVRFPGIFGYNGPSHLGLNRAIASAINDRSPPTIVGNGHGRRNYIFVQDAARALIHVADSEANGVFLSGGGSPVHIWKMMELICDVFLPGTRPNYVDGPEARDQLVTPSRSLPPTQQMDIALKAIKTEADAHHAP